MQRDIEKLAAYYADAPDDLSLVDLDLERIPRHVSIIMDGNGRWATARGLDRSKGHVAGVDALREAVTTSVRLGIDVFTVYAFSTENWRRPKREVDLLMHLFATTLVKELPLFHQENVRLRFLGDIDALPERGSALLFVIGREFGGEARPLPAYGAEGCDEPAGAARGADAELEAAAVAFAFSDAAHACETNENFYPTDQPADSAWHVAVCAVDGRVVLVDLASSNGTTLRRADGSQVDLGHDPAMGERPAAAACRGDRIYLGDSEFEIL